MVKGFKKVHSKVKLYSYYFSNNVSNDINVSGILQSRLTLLEINKGMFNQIFCHGKNDLQNQVPLGFFQARGAKWGYITKKNIVLQWP